MFKGSIVAIVTPFKNGKFDEKTYGDLIEWHIKQGTHGIVPCGTTGEASTLGFEEHYRVIEVAVKAANKRIPVIAGTGANSTDEAIEITKKSKKNWALMELCSSRHITTSQHRKGFTGITRKLQMR